MKIKKVKRYRGGMQKSMKQGRDDMKVKANLQSPISIAIPTYFYTPAVCNLV